MGGGVLLLASDFGLDSVYTGQMRAAALRAAPGVAVHDLWHGVPAHRVDLAAFLLPRLWCQGPPGAVVAAVIDPGVGTARRALAVRRVPFLLVGPDNGLFTAALEAGAEARLLEPARLGLAGLSTTFHGRDLFAPAAARLAAGTLAFTDLPHLPGAPPVRLALPGAERLPGGGLRGEVVWADRFGNLVTSLPGEALPPAGWRLRIGGRTLPGLRTYGDVAPGDLLALVGSFGLLEAACREGSAQALLGLEPGAEAVVERRP